MSTSPPRTKLNSYGDKRRTMDTQGERHGRAAAPDTGSWARGPGRSDGILALAAGLAALALYLFTLAPSITSANGAGDSGELAAAAYTLGITHPTGYPLYTLLGYAVARLVPGEPAHSLNAFSALMGALAVGLLTLTALRAGERALPRAPRPLLYTASLLAAAALALDTDFWTETVVTETRTLALALDALVLALLVVPARRRAGPSLAAALVYGLALCDHLLSLYLAPAVVILVAAWAGRDVRHWLALLGLFLLGLTPYLYLPLRAAAHPLANWGDPATPARFVWVVTGQEYRSSMFGLDAAGLAAAIQGSLAVLWDGLGAATIVAATIGLGVLWRPHLPAAGGPVRLRRGGGGLASRGHARRAPGRAAPRRAPRARRRGLRRPRAPLRRARDAPGHGRAVRRRRLVGHVGPRLWRADRARPAAALRHLRQRRADVGRGVVRRAGPGRGPRRDRDQPPAALLHLVL